MQRRLERFSNILERNRPTTTVKVEVVIMVRNVEMTTEPTTGDPDPLIRQIISTCQRLEVPLVFSLTRRQLGHLLHRHIKYTYSVSCAAILDSNGISPADLSMLASLTVQAQQEFALQFSLPRIPSNHWWPAEEVDAFWLGCQLGYPITVLEQCLRQGHQIDAVDAKTGDTALMRVLMWQDDVEKVTWMVDTLRADVSMKNFMGRTALWFAAKFDRFRCFCWMVERGSCAFQLSWLDWEGKGLEDVASERILQWLSREPNRNDP